MSGAFPFYVAGPPGPAATSEDPCGWRRWCVPLNALGHSGVDRDSIPAARGLLQRLKLHVDPILRRRGWRVKHLHEHNGRGPGGMCYHDLQGTADISIRLRAVAGACLRKPCQGYSPQPRFTCGGSAWQETRAATSSFRLAGCSP